MIKSPTSWHPSSFRLNHRGKTDVFVAIVIDGNLARNYVRQTCEEAYSFGVTQNFPEVGELSAITDK